MADEKNTETTTATEPGANSACPEAAKQISTNTDSADKGNTLKVRDANGQEVQFKIKRMTPLRKLMEVYCTRVGGQQDAFRFLFDGHRIMHDDTPESLEMEELDCVDAMVTKVGGSVLVH